MWFRSIFNGLKSGIQSTANLLKKGGLFLWNNAPQILGGVKSISTFVGRHMPHLRPVTELVNQGADLAQGLYDYLNQPSAPDEPNE